MSRFRTASLVAALAIVACGDSTGPADDLARNRERWQAQDIADYEFAFRRSCFCPVEGVQSVQIRVADGAVASVIDALGQPVASVDVARYFTVTIDSLFGVVGHAIAVHAHRLTVRYHPTLGYPETIAIDYDATMVDEEMTYEAGLLLPFSP